MTKLFKNIFCLMIITCFFFGAKVVKADKVLNVNLGSTQVYNMGVLDNRNIEMLSISEKSFANLSNKRTATCDYILGDPEDPEKASPAYWLQFCLNIIKYIGIIALLGLSSADFLKALTQNDKDAVKKATTTTAKRFVYLVLLFFLPIIVEVLMKMFGAYGTCGIG